MATQDDYIKTALRLPRDLHAKLQGTADRASRSMNAEIVARLQASFALGGDESALTEAQRQLRETIRAEVELYLLRERVDELKKS